MNRFRPRRRTILLAVLALLVSPLVFLGYVLQVTSGYRYDDPARLPVERIAVVFGAGVRRDGRPSRMLADRVQAAVDLYQAGRVRKLLMTGDNSSVDYDEVSAMRDYALERGVAPADIALDFAGFSTYESCFRAQAIFGVDEAVLITQRYHLPRAVYTCRELGIDAVGLGTPDWGRYSPLLMRRYTTREAVATLNALWQVHVTRPLPTFLGPFEGIG